MCMGGKRNHNFHPDALSWICCVERMIGGSITLGSLRLILLYFLLFILFRSQCSRCNSSHFIYYRSIDCYATALASLFFSPLWAYDCGRTNTYNQNTAWIFDMQDVYRPLICSHSSSLFPAKAAAAAALLLIFTWFSSVYTLSTCPSWICKDRYCKSIVSSSRIVWTEEPSASFQDPHLEFGGQLRNVPF